MIIPKTGIDSRIESGGRLFGIMLYFGRMSMKALRLHSATSLLS
jgi:hypothetical protein